MKKYVKVNPDFSCAVFCGSNYDWAIQNGFQEENVEQNAYGAYYLAGHVPAEAQKSYQEKRQEEYPPIPEQLDMIYWDKVNGTNLWVETITQIKAKYPKE